MSYKRKLGDKKKFEKRLKINKNKQINKKKLKEIAKKYEDIWKELEELNQ